MESVVADIAEYVAIKRGHVYLSTIDNVFSEDEYIDELVDEYPYSEINDGITLPDHMDIRTEVLERAKDVISERREHIGDLYPFRFDPVMKRLDYIGDTNGAYEVILALLLSHANDHRGLFAPLNEKPVNAFEDVVESVLRNAGFLAKRTGRSRGQLASTLGDVFTHLSLPHVVDKIREIDTDLNDAGTDVLARFPWGNDTRPGQWKFCVQATCGQYSEWPKKMRIYGFWDRVFDPWSSPVFVLSVPHHAPENVLQKLWGSGDPRTQFLDRVRLLPFLSFTEIVVDSAIRWIKDETDFDWLVSA